MTLKCKECKAEIKFIEHKPNKRMPVNAETVSGYRYDAATGKYYYTTIFVPHWATCPQADLFRKSREKPDLFKK